MMNLKKLHDIICRLVVLAFLLPVPTILQAQNFHFDNIFDFNHVLAYLVAGFLIGIFLLLFYNRLYIYREQDINKQQHSQNARLSIIMQTGRMRMWIYDTVTRHYKYISETGETVQEYNPIDFARFFERDDFEMMRSAIFDICENRRFTSTIHLRNHKVN